MAGELGTDSPSGESRQQPLLAQMRSPELGVVDVPYLLEDLWFVDELVLPVDPYVAGEQTVEVAADPTRGVDAVRDADGRLPQQVMPACVDDAGVALTHAVDGRCHLDRHCAHIEPVAFSGM